MDATSATHPLIRGEYVRAGAPGSASAVASKPAGVRDVHATTKMGMKKSAMMECVPKLRPVVGKAMVETADEEKLKESAQLFTHISTHNAYHIGQIIYVRKEQGSWDPKNGVN